MAFLSPRMSHMAQTTFPGGVGGRMASLPNKRGAMLDSLRSAPGDQTPASGVGGMLAQSGSPAAASGGTGDNFAPVIGAAPSIGAAPGAAPMTGLLSLLKARSAPMAPPPAIGATPLSPITPTTTARPLAAAPAAGGVIGKAMPIGGGPDISALLAMLQQGGMQR